MIHVLAFFGWIYDHVIHVNFKHVYYFVLEDFIHHHLVSGACIPQTESHDVVHVVGALGHEHRVFSVFFIHGNPVVTGVGIHER